MVLSGHNFASSSMTNRKSGLSQAISRKILEYRDAPNLIRGLDDDEKGTQKVSTLGGEQQMSVITESGLYHVILNAKTERVKPFRRWVTEEVLPQIRKTGSYSVKTEAAMPSAQQVEYHLRIAAALGDVGFSRGVQQAYLLEQDQKQFDATAEHFLPLLAAGCIFFNHDDWNGLH